MRREALRVPKNPTALAVAKPGKFPMLLGFSTLKSQLEYRIKRFKAHLVAIWRELRKTSPQQYTMTVEM